MNIFRLIGDMLHLLSIITLLLKIHATKSCRGISFKTQELYALVFITRYLDLFFRYISFGCLAATIAATMIDMQLRRRYNTVMKLIFISSSLAICYYMRVHKVVRQTYDRNEDTFREWFLVAPCALLAVLLPQQRTPVEVLWTFSIYLEAVAILPQLILLQRTQNIDNLTGNYVALLGSYRAFYILNWIYKYFTESRYRQWIVWVSGVVQTIIYVDFFYYYLKSWRTNEKLQLPA